jgi:hypothetical protein
MAAPTLFNRPDIMSTVYTAAPVAGRFVAEGDRVEAHAAADGGCIHLVKGHVTVGRLEGDGANALLETLRAPGCAGVISMTVQRVSRVSGFIKAIAADGKRNK